MTEPRYRRPKKTLKLRFDDPEMEGLLVSMRQPSVGELMEWKDADGIVEETESASQFLLSWNLDDDDGQPVPCDQDGLLSQPKPFTLAVLLAMWEAAVGVSLPLYRPSTDGEQSPEPSIPMEPL